MRRFWIPAVVALLSLTGIVLTADALVTTEREQLDAFVEDVTNDKADQRIDAVMSHLSPADVAVRLTADGHTTSFDADNGADLAEAARSALSVFDSDRQSLLQQSVEVRDNGATVVTRFGDNDYEQTVIFELVHTDDRWVVRSVRTL